jgi:actin-related protein 9
MLTLSPADNSLDPETVYRTLSSWNRYKEGLIKVSSDGQTAAPEDEGATDIAAAVVRGRKRTSF